MTSASTYTYGIDYNPVMGVVTRARGRKKVVQGFLSVDPLTAAYPELTPYQFASNSPIENIDLDGLEAFSVHGTKSDDTAFDLMSSDDMRRLAGNDYQTVVRGFEWPKGTNGFANGEKDRAIAAGALADFVMDNRVDGEDITLIAHSHGGNVSIQAARLLRKRLDENYKTRDVKINLVTLATPAFNGEGDIENPSDAPLNSHTHFYSEHDAVQTKMANGIRFHLFGSRRAKRTYDNNLTTNIKVDDTIERDSPDPTFPGKTNTRKVRKYGPTESHSLQRRPELLIMPKI